MWGSDKLAGFMERRFMEDLHGFCTLWCFCKHAHCILYMCTFNKFHTNIGKYIDHASGGGGGARGGGGCKIKIQ